MSVSRDEVESYLHTYRSDIHAALRSAELSLLADVEALLSRGSADPQGRVFALGNGGSWTMAQSFGAYLQSKVGRPIQRHVTWSLAEVLSATTATNFEHSFVRLLQQGAASRHDLVVVFSVSGLSPNIVAAAEYCIANQIPVLAFTGLSGGKLRELSISSFRAGSDNQQIAEDSILLASYILVSDLTGRVGRTDEAANWTDQWRREILPSAIVDQSLDPDPIWLGQAASAVADAVRSGRRIVIVAPEGDRLGYAVEHIAHNLRWDLTKSTDLEFAPDIRSDLSVADYTGISNDVGASKEVFLRLLGPLTHGELAFVFAGDPSDDDVEAFRESALSRGLNLYGWYGEPYKSDYNEIATFGCKERVWAPVAAQVAGHVLLQLARDELLRSCHPTAL